jgi:hypothetical protein
MPARKPVDTTPDTPEVETVSVDVPVPTNLDTGAFKTSLDLKDKPDEDLSEEDVQRKHHPEWYSDKDAKSSDVTQAAGSDED